MLPLPIALFLVFASAVALAPPPSVIEACLLNYGTIGWTPRAIGRVLRTDRRTQELIDLYQKGPGNPSWSTAPAAPFHWKDGNGLRDSRAFKAGPESLKADPSFFPDRGMDSPSYQDYLAEVHLMKKFSSALRDFKENPEDEKAMARLAACTSEYLTRTGVPNKIDSRGHKVIVEPMDEAVWFEWNQKNHSGAGDERPQLVLLARYLKRRNLALVFHMDTVAGINNSGGHFLRDVHISLGLKDLIDTDLTASLLHEKIHHESHLNREKPWGTWTSFEEEILKPSLRRGTGQDEGGANPIASRALRPKLPYLAVTNQTDSELKGTNYAKEYLIEEAECCYRQALLYAERAERFKGIAERESDKKGLHYQRLMEEARKNAKLAVGRIQWVQRFTKVTNGALYDATITPGSPLIASQDRFSLRPSFAAPFDYELLFEDGKAVRFMSAQFPDFPKKARTEEEKARQIIYLKVLMDQVRLTNLAIQFNAAELRKSLTKTFELPD